MYVSPGAFNLMMDSITRAYMQQDTTIAAFEALRMSEETITNVVHKHKQQFGERPMHIVVDHKMQLNLF